MEFFKKLKEKRRKEKVKDVKKLFALKFFGGVFSGLGTVVGATVIVGLFLYVLGKLELVPFLGDFATRVVEIVQGNLGD